MGWYVETVIHAQCDYSGCLNEIADGGNSQTQVLDYLRSEEGWSFQYGTTPYIADRICRCPEHKGMRIGAEATNE